MKYAPSLNYLRVLGGADNSTRFGWCSEHEFLTNTLAFSLLFYHQQTQPQDNTELTSQDLVSLKLFCEKLFQCQMIESLFCDKRNAHHDHLWRELQSKGELLIHNHDGRHGFYMEIVKTQEKRRGGCLTPARTIDMYQLRFYNAGKGLEYHQQPRKIWAKGRKRYTKKVVENFPLTAGRLSFFVQNLKNDNLHSLKRVSIHLYYIVALLGGSSSSQGVACQSKLQAKQRNRTCQIKSLKVVARQMLSEPCYRLWKKSLLELTIENVAEVEPRLARAREQAITQARKRVDSMISKNQVVNRFGGSPLSS